LFERLKRYQLKLSPIKCSFRVKSRKLLGFVVGSQDIKIDLDKIKAIQAMQLLKERKK